MAKRKTVKKKRMNQTKKAQTKAPEKKTYKLDDRFFNEIYNIYKKDLIVLEKANGWKGWNGFSTPARCRDFGFPFRYQLHKVTFEICKTKTMPTEEKAHEALRKELEDRIARASQPFVSGIIRYFQSKNKAAMDCFLDSLEQLTIDNCSELIKLVETKVDTVWGNEFFQRLKDIQCYREDLDYLEDLETKICDEAKS